ncbi:aspartate 1-decarboxylase [Caldalkalibacillus salinus]|uniref:aspartate 1-decarboxylase n=1 Tax=Caldalkalibacillus salinus TaxID=2803787 RepID=UPI001924ED85
MFRHMMKAKLHKATVTEANLNYVGSITIDQDLLDQVDILPQEKVQVVNNNNGARLETYVIPGERGSGVICLNGAAARLVQPGDTVIVISYAMVEEKELNQFRSKVAIMDKDNRIAQLMNQEVHGTIPTV